ncbi:MAG: protein jag [Bacteroidales bacterium]|nr:protein jag [Lachnoclostridium sp.]MCM1384904.1 protein jag [Lachnoclostridium sp.]MCM1465614.1 protein jag [Bacteroidales bacterium]
MEFIEVSAKTVNDAITEACQKLGVTSDKLYYEIIEEGSSGFLGIGSKLAIIKAAKKCSVEDNAKDFLNNVFEAMKLTVTIDIKYDEQEHSMDVELNGDDMGVLIGKRGQTLDSLQYLLSLVVNKDVEEYVRVKVDTENYRQRRKETLENLAKNIAYKVKRNRKPISLEPMNPYERRIIHSTLQNDKYVTTHSEGDEPFRRIVVTLRRENRDFKDGRDYRENREYRKRQDMKS